MQELIEKANILIEALPYIKEFSGKTIVMKYGGAAMVKEDLKETTMQDIVLMKYVGMNPVVVHGGGPEITEFMTQLGLEPKFVHGHRYTDERTIEIVEMVLTGKINKEIVSLLNQHGGSAVGISGKDANLIQAKKFIPTNHRGIPEEDVPDLGFVGDIDQVNPQIIQALTQDGFIPVISPLGADKTGRGYNINADLVAAAIAGALRAEKLVLLTDAPGILRNPNDESSLIPTIHKNEIEFLIEDKIISGGMLPKIEACIRALESGVAKTHIIDGRVPHAVLLEIYTQKGIGTEILL
ncbi:MAG: acetylglutamate kinase [bacterium]|nr:acetylglutamate kinase [bacterium]